MQTSDQVIEANPSLKIYRVTLRESHGDRFTIVFDCFAEDKDHACEQASGAYERSKIVDIKEVVQ